MRAGRGTGRGTGRRTKGRTKGKTKGRTHDAGPARTSRPNSVVFSPPSSSSVFSDSLLVPMRAATFPAWLRAPFAVRSPFVPASLKRLGHGPSRELASLSPHGPHLNLLALSHASTLARLLSRAFPLSRALLLPLSCPTTAVTPPRSWPSLELTSLSPHGPHLPLVFLSHAPTLARPLLPCLSRPHSLTPPSLSPLACRSLTPLSLGPNPRAIMSLLSRLLSCPTHAALAPLSRPLSCPAHARAPLSRTLTEGVVVLNGRGRSDAPSGQLRSNPCHRFINRTTNET